MATTPDSAPTPANNAVRREGITLRAIHGSRDEQYPEGGNRNLWYNFRDTCKERIRDIMAEATMEERLARLETEVERLKTNLPPTNGNAIPWWEKIAGTFADSEDYEEAMRLGREWRQSQRLEEDEEPDASV